MNQEDFTKLLPARPYCTDDFGNGLHRCSRAEAVQKRIVQPNAEMLRRVLVFDLDDEDSWYVPEERGCPPPTFISINRANGHAHVGYLLSAPVSLSTKSRGGPMNFLLDVQRGLTHKLGADRSYGGLVCKNPVHPHWETDWQAVRPYDLSYLNDCLDASDKRRSKRESTEGLGRNCKLFEDLTKVARVHTLAVKRDGGSYENLWKRLEAIAWDINRAFVPSPLHRAELHGVVRSVARFAWRVYTDERFSAIQQARARRRWKDHIPLSQTRPWEALEICKRTWQRHQAAQRMEPRS